MGKYLYFPCLSGPFRVPKILVKSAQARLSAYDDRDVVAPVFACTSRSDDILVIATLSDSCVTHFLEQGKGDESMERQGKYGSSRNVGAEIK